jgi:hypothetical protein
MAPLILSFVVTIAEKISKTDVFSIFGIEAGTPEKYVKIIHISHFGYNSR